MQQVHVPASGVVELGKRKTPEAAGKQEKEKKPTVDKITDLELLHKMMRLTNSRGKR